jgi:hypothetical protein
MSNVAFSRAIGHAFKQSKDMPPVPKGKNPLIGFAMGFLLGPAGVAIYLRSVGDGLLTLAMVLLGTFFTAGFAAPIAWALCGCWCYVRIRNSNNQNPAPPASDSSSTHQLLTSHHSGVSPAGRENVVLRAHES